MGFPRIPFLDPFFLLKWGLRMETPKTRFWGPMKTPPKKDCFLLKKGAHPMTSHLKHLFINKKL